MTNPINDLAKSDCILVIGSNFAENHPIVSRWVLDAKERGATLIVADPRVTATAWSADLHLPLMPGSDTSLINAMMHVIISEGLQNDEFVQNNTENYEALRELAQKYTPEIAERATHVPAEKIIKAARAYAKAKAASIVYCMGVTQHTCGTETVINCANLSMLCGQVGRPGTGVNPLRGQDNVQGACDMGALVNVFPGYQPVSDPAVREKFALAWNCLPEQFSAKPGLTLVEMTHAALRDEVRGMLVMGENPIVGDPNSNHVRQALEHVEFLAVMELFMSETAELADIILPAASFAEKRGTKTSTERRVQWMERAIEPVGEARPDWQIICDLATRLGLAAAFPYATEEQIFTSIQRLTPSYAGITPARLKKTPGGLQWPCPTSGHPGTPILHSKGFAKPNGKGQFTPVEYKLPADEVSEEYPLVLTSGRVVMHYNSGAMTRRTRALIQREPENFVQMNHLTAAKFGIEADGMAKVITRRGQATAKARLTRQIPEGVLFMPFHFLETNQLTIDALDPVAKIPEYKVAAARIEPAAPEAQEALEVEGGLAA
jgi:formate dehydrogenase alpha subunit